MAVRAYWKGSLKLSLVTCPILLYPATTTTDKTRFHMINKETGHRLKKQMKGALLRMRTRTLMVRSAPSRVSNHEATVEAAMLRVID
jgi:hypothetical protein